MTLSGQLTTLEIDSSLLKGNPLGDPSVRQCPVYLPPGFDLESSKKLPLFFDLAPFTSSGLARVGWKNFYRSIPEIIDQLIVAGKMKPIVVVFPDCFTKLGGNQYINSSAIGPYADHIMQEVVPLVESAYNCGGQGNRAVYGYSSGGYAALIYGMLYPEFWSAIACHSGDIGFELAYLYDMPSILLAYEKYDFSARKFLDKFWEKGRPSGSDIHILMVLAMAASYDGEACDMKNLEIPLPVDLKTMEVVQERWAQWLRYDPLEVMKSKGQNLSALKKVFIDCGAQDEYRLQFGARKLSAYLEKNKISHEYQEFEGTHLGIEYRLETSLPLLATSF